VTPPGSVEGDGRIRLFLALELPGAIEDALAGWGRKHLTGGRRPESLHITLAFLGSQPPSALAPIMVALRREAAATEPILLEPVRYRETHSVGMLVLADPTGRATVLANRLQLALEEIGVYERERRPWVPHVTVLRFRERPRLDPPLPACGPFAPSGAAALLSRLHRSGARYEVVETCALAKRG
jgi:RNA 2',3'-cyclic 3'-phosphodiesterase